MLRQSIHVVIAQSCTDNQNSVRFAAVQFLSNAVTKAAFHHDEIGIIAATAGLVLLTP